jgi:DNA-binding response OmpR family regulator
VLVAALEAGDHDVESIARPSDIADRNDLSDFDAVILDAGGGGIEALHAVRARGSDVPVLVASGHLVEPNDPWTQSVLKPFGLDTLEATMRTLSALRPRG